jgi:hypothetical protein
MAATRPGGFSLAETIVLLLLIWCLARRDAHRPAGSIRLGPPQLIPLAADQATIAAKLLASTIGPWLRGDDLEAPE